MRGEKGKVLRVQAREFLLHCEEERRRLSDRERGGQDFILKYVFILKYRKS
jgi:hypothetical protein